MKKILFALLFVALVSSAAMAQLMLGVSGALHMDKKLGAKDISQRFQDGEGIFYGPLIEIVGKNLGVGIAGNVSFYSLDQNFYDNSGNLLYSKSFKMTDYDLTAYLMYHLFGGKAFLDPFGEFGGGIVATGFQNDSDNQQYNPYDSKFLMASYYWYAGLGLGVNLGPIGIFGKFSFNYPIKKDFQTNLKPSYGGGSTTLYPYGYDEVLYPNGYLAKYRFTLGAKLIL
jgi:hypothetical protein